MEIKVLKKEEEPRWDQFVKGSESSTFFQQTGWKNVVQKTYGHKPLYLFAEDNGEIIGILPLFVVSSFVFGKRLVSIPYGPYGGCSAVSQEASDSLIQKAKELSTEFKVKYVELRSTANVSGIPTNENHVTMLLDLTPGEEIVWSNLRKGMKACVKRAVKEDFVVNLNSQHVDDFYSVYCERMRELGTPVPPFLFFKNIKDNFPDTSIATIESKGEILASQILLPFKKTVIYGWGASSKRNQEAHPVHLLLWKVIQNSIAQGYHIFDFGRSTQNSGTYDFKKWWGAEPQPLFYQYIFINRDQEIPYVHPSNPKYDLAIKIWRKLPLAIANWLGPFFSKELI